MWRDHALLRRTVPSDSLNLLSRYRSTVFASIGWFLITAPKLRPRVLITGTCRPQISTRNSSPRFRCARLLDLWRRGLEYSESLTFGLRIQTSNGFAERQSLVLVESQSLGQRWPPTASGRGARLIRILRSADIRFVRFNRANDNHRLNWLNSPNLPIMIPGMSADDEKATFR